MMTAKFNKLKQTKKDNTMKYTNEFDINTFNFWSGAKDTVDDIQRAGKMEELGTLIEDTFSYDAEPPSETDINDFVWFERDFIYESLGLDENGNLPDDLQETEE